ncbi:hypothetical protein CERSUDRAFT_101132 [Gelatoporia subvermispora B]|uniref:DNA-directed RNA polymerase n=1 Tax=Ceriporiopsis subvermispora (strain B) TaxID=914234 RepID=M2P5X1_CERS8|nr:hypothetical protein CERSUDRAFT_101132 [Gelatoporia subvermispora B]
MYLLPQIAKDAVLAKNVQQEPVFTSLRTVTAVEEIWYDPDPQSTTIEEDALFVESFTVPDEGAETTLHLQSLWPLRLESYCGEFDADPFVIWSGDNSEKLIMRCEFSVAWIKMKTAWTVSRRTSCGLLAQARQGHHQEGRHIKVREEKEWTLEMDRVNLKAVVCIDDVALKHTYSNSCVEIFNVLSIEAARAAFIKELRVTLESDGPY